MLKISGLLLIALAGFFLGNSASEEKRKHIEILIRLREVLTFLREEIHYLEVPLTEVFLAQEIQNKKELAEYFQEVALEMQKFQGKPLPVLLKEKLPFLEKNAGFTEKECETLLLYLGQLGGVNKGKQIKVLERYEKELERKIEELQKEYEKNAGLYRSMGMLGGIFLGILLL